MMARRFVAAFSFVALLVGCEPNLSAPRDAHITCASSAECPEGLSCRTAIGRCVANDADDVPPELLQASVAETRVTRNGDIHVTLTASEPLFAAPTVVLDGIDDRTFALQSQDGQSYAFTYLVRGDEGDGPRAVVATFVDLHGNQATATIGTLSIDLVAPGLAGGISVSPAVVGQSGTVEISFTATEALAEAPTVALRWLDSENEAFAVITSGDPADAAPGFVATYTVVGDEPPEAAVIEVSLRDVAGQSSVVQSAPLVRVDATGPALLTGSAFARLQAGAGNPVLNVAAATFGTRIEVGFTLDEQVGATPTVTLGDTTAFTLVSTAGTSFVFAVTLDALATPDLSQGPNTLQVVAEDVFGNSASFALRDATDAELRVNVDTLPPDSPNVSDERVVHERAPWGSLASDGQPKFAVRGAAGAVEPNTQVIVYDGPNRSTAARLGFGPSDESGAFDGSSDAEPITLISVDRPAVYVGAVDDAGNVSPLVAVEHIAWTATLNGKVADDTLANPHTLVERRYFGDTLVQPDDVEPLEVANVGALDGTSLTSTGAGTWRLVPDAAPALPKLSAHALTYDPLRGRALMYGDAPRGCFGNVPRFWELATPPWRTLIDPNAATPGALSGAMLSFDTRRDRLVLFSTEGLTWEWNGALWRQVCTTTACTASKPAGRTSTAMVYDPHRGVSVLFGGFIATPPYQPNNQVWEWDGSTWTQRCLDATCQASQPSARQSHAMVFDQNLGEVLLFGGSSGAQETWSWNGSRWLARCTQEPCSLNRPVARTGAGLAFDSRRGEVVLFGGAGVSGVCPAPTLADTWVWNGSTWTERSPATSPSQRYGHKMVFHAAMGKTVLVGGQLPQCSVSCGTDEGSNESWVWDGSTWAQLPAEDAAQPGAAGQHVAAFDPVRRRVVMTGGTLGTAMWEWTGERWVSTTPVPSVTRSQAGLASYGFVGSARLLFGGGDNGSGSMQTGAARLEAGSWQSNTWGPGNRLDFAMSSDGMGNIVVAAGSTTSDVNNDTVSTTHVWNGSTWTEVCTTGNPCTVALPKLLGARMAQATSGGGIVLYGGARVAPGCDPAPETYLWSGSTWTLAAPATSPRQRWGHQMTYNAALGGALMTGGNDQRCMAVGEGPDSELRDTWLWRNNNWSRIDIVDIESDGQPLTTISGAMAYDPLRDQVLLHGGTAFYSDYTSTSGPSWVGSLGGTKRPAHVVKIAFANAGLSGTETLERIDVSWHGEALGHDGSTPVNELSLALWDFDHFRTLSVTSGAEGATWSSQEDEDFADRAALRRLLVGAEQALTFAAQPAAPNGAGPAFGHITTDYLEVTVRYRR